MKHPGPSAEKNSLSVCAPDARREAVFFLRRQPHGGLSVLRYGMQRFSGNIRRSMVGRAAGPVDHDRIWVQPPPYGAGLIPAVGGAVRLSAVTPEYAVTSFGPFV